MEGFDILQASMGFGGEVRSWLEMQVIAAFSSEAVGTYWMILSGLTVYAAIAIFISSVDDAFLDLYFWVLTAQRVITRPFRWKPTTRQLHELPQKRLAVMVPAWHEADVIGRMLANTLNTLDYDNFEIFVGVYPNDRETIDVVEQFIRQNDGVNIAYVGHDGPTCKADNLNWMIAGIVAREEELGLKFDGVVMQDSEDVIHPMSFKVINAYLDRAEMLQLPVLSMPRKWSSLTACHYMDEFAEWHGKDLVARSHLTDLVPSAGVATAFSRSAIELLRQERQNQPFNVDSLTEDYDIGHRFYEAGLKSMFVRYWAKMPYGTRTSLFGNRTVTKYRKELVSTREFFPDNAKISIRQKSRWMLGISYLGWKQLGWIGPASHRYFLYRDRKAIWTAPTGMLAYAIVFQWALYWLVATLFPNAGTLPSLMDPNSWVWTIVLINFVFLVNRVIHRMIFTFWAHGLKYALLAPIRMVWANYIGFMASMRAARRYAWHVISGNRLTWDKTMHAYPSMEELGQGEAKHLGEALIYWGAIDQNRLQKALEHQKANYRPLGLLLLDQAAVSEEQLADAIATHESLPRIDLDPLSVKSGDLGRLSPEVAARFSALSFGRAGGALNVAIGEPLNSVQRQALSKAAGSKVILHVTPLSDISFGIRYAYNSTLIDPDLRAARVLRKLSMLTKEQAEGVWRSIRRDQLRLGDLLVRRGAIEHAQLMLQQGGFDTPDEEALAQKLISSGYISQTDFKAARAAAPKPPFEFISRAKSLGYISDVDIDTLEESHGDLMMENA